jgi:hypothetical protein
MEVVAEAWSWFLFQPARGGNGHAFWREAAPGSNTVSLGRHTSLVTFEREPWRGETLRGLEPESSVASVFERGSGEAKRYETER